MDTTATESGSDNWPGRFPYQPTASVIEDCSTRPHGPARSRHSKRYAHLLDDYPPGCWSDLFV